MKDDDDDDDDDRTRMRTRTIRGRGRVRTMACPSPHYNATTNQTIDNGNTQQSKSTREKGRKMIRMDDRTNK
jgi:hypothetical protein